MKNNTVTLNKIASVLKNVPFSKTVQITSLIQSIEGEIVVVRALQEQKKYGKLELPNGKFSKIKKGDVFVGVLGQRKALEGIVGEVPKNLKVNDVIHVLNLGGVLGMATSWNPDIIDTPLPVQVLGAIEKNNATLTLGDFSLKPEKKLYKSAPIVFVLGSSMGVGKTTVVSSLITLLAKKNSFKVAAGKLTGVASQRDLLAMKKAGACEVLSFLDVGLTSTINQNGLVLSAANTVINTLNKHKPDIIVVELGDGVVGWYGVSQLLQKKSFISSSSFIIACANDLVGATGLYEVLQKMALTIDFFAGPVANNSAGTEYLEQFFNVAGQDLRHDHSKLVETLVKKGIQIHD